MADERYNAVARTIREHGTPNPQFPKDIDIEYSGTFVVAMLMHKQLIVQPVLRKYLNAVDGLGTVLKNMKSNVCILYLTTCLNVVSSCRIQ